MNLLQLWLQPALQGYPPFLNFEALYNATQIINSLVNQDVAALLEGRYDVFLHQIQMHVPEYLSAAATFIENFGLTEILDVNATNHAMITFLTGLCILKLERLCGLSDVDPK